MRIPNDLKNKKENENVIKKEVKSDITENKIHIEEMKPFKYSYFSDYENEKVFTKMIKKIEKQIRNSDEYKRYISFLKKEQDLTNCDILKGIDCKDNKKIRIEMHHYPFTLFEIVNIAVLSQSCNYTQPINPFLISNEVMRLHFENKIGIVPLSISIHKLFHVGEIFIPLNDVFGDVKSFIDEYEDFIPDELTDRLNELSELSKEESSLSHNKYLLSKVFSVMEIENQTPFHKLDLDDKKENNNIA